MENKNCDSSNKKKKHKEKLTKYYSKLSYEFKNFIKFSAGSLKSLFLVLWYGLTVLGFLFIIWSETMNKNNNKKEKNILDGGI